ncbi:uncharacterized protein [Oscarella lobularis]|uniref:uncharacterized protein n=1 Tax=Oscarella lobularis TaxID=121494 RepID=UPI00331400D9
MESFKAFPWFHGSISREETEGRLMRLGLKEGLFLIRESQRMPGSLVLSLCSEGKVVNFKISQITYDDDSSLYHLDNGPNFSSIEDMIGFYKKRHKDNPIWLGSHCPKRDISKPSRDRRGGYEQVWLASSTKDKKEKKEEEIAMDLAAEINQLAIEEPETVAAAKEQRTKMEKKFRESKIAILEAVGNFEEELEDNPESKTKKFDRRQKSFKLSAHTEKLMYLTWLNEQLDTETKNLDEDIRGAIPILKVMEKVSGQAAPIHSPKPITSLQMSDNWHAVLKFMKILQISTEDLEFADLYQLDEREILKLFSRLLKWEAETKK